MKSIGCPLPEAAGMCSERQLLEIVEPDAGREGRRMLFTMPLALAQILSQTHFLSTSQHTHALVLCGLFRPSPAAYPLFYVLCTPYSLSRIACQVQWKQKNNNHAGSLAR
jgi:hypothetical protein